MLLLEDCVLHEASDLLFAYVSWFQQFPVGTIIRQKDTYFGKSHYLKKIKLTDVKWWHTTVMHNRRKYTTRRVPTRPILL